MCSCQIKSKLSIEKDIIEKARKNFIKPDRNVEDMRINTSITTCKMNTKNKNLWITGTKDKLINFIHNAIDDQPTHVFYRTSKDSWIHYHDQPFIIYCLYDKKNRQNIIREIRQVGEWCPRKVGRNFNHEINPDLYHCIILSIFTPEDYCNGLKYKDNLIGGLKWRYDTLVLK